MAETRDGSWIKLHRCPNELVRLRAHPCHRVQKALAAARIEYEVVKHPWRPERRDELERLSGQRKLPVIEFESGATYREESKAMAERIAAGHLAEHLARLPRADRPPA
jgi:glutathione S-transferase